MLCLMELFSGSFCNIGKPPKQILNSHLANIRSQYPFWLPSHFSEHGSVPVVGSTKLENDSAKAKNILWANAISYNWSLRCVSKRISFFCCICQSHGHSSLVTIAQFVGFTRISPVISYNTYPVRFFVVGALFLMIFGTLWCHFLLLSRSLCAIERKCLIPTLVEQVAVRKETPEGKDICHASSQTHTHIYIPAI